MGLKRALSASSCVSALEHAGGSSHRPARAWPRAAMWKAISSRFLDRLLDKGLPSGHGQVGNRVDDGHLNGMLYRAVCEKAIASWTADRCSELKTASPDRQVAQIRRRSAYGTRYQSLRHIKREVSIGSSQPMTGQRFGPDDRGNRAPPGPLPEPEGKARRVGRSRSRSLIGTILTLVAERNL